MQIVGYQLVGPDNEIVEQWGGTWGQRPGIPNPVRLPNGDHVHAPALNTNYNGYTLVEWHMEEPPISVPQSITPRQCRLVLMSQGLLDQVEQMISASTRDVQITWEYATEFRRDDVLLNQLAVELNLQQEQIDQFFIAAAQL